MAIITNRIHSTHLVMDKWEKIGIDMSTNKWVYNIRSQDIRIWIEEQPIYMWKYYDIPFNTDLPLIVLNGSNYIFTPEMEVWFKLRWQ
jgi:hypothetical protein